MTTKAEIRKRLRATRRDHVAALPDAIRTLVFHRPPAPLLELVPEEATVGLYRAGPLEAPMNAYARFLFERGHTLALPRFATRTAPMQFARHADPYEESDCEIGPFGLLQPKTEARAAVPEILFVPLLGFTDRGDRIGQGGGHYDCWLAEHPATLAIGVGWDAQLVESLPVESHDVGLRAVVTPTRLYGPF